MAINTLFRLTTRLFLPHLAKQMTEEGAFYLYDGRDADAELDRYIIVEDHGADVTIFCFSGLAVLVAGLCRRAFRELFPNEGRDFNFVFLRDLRRMAYHVAPDGQRNGLAFYTDKVRQTMESLGAKHNIAVGDSVGGSAAFYFGTKCAMDHIVAFSPAFPETVFTAPHAQLKTYFDVGKLFTHPGAYIELLLVTVSACWARRQIRKAVGEDALWDVMAEYRNAGADRPTATVFYGEKSGPDARQAALLSDLPTVKLAPLPTGRHDCPAYLRRRGTLAEAIVQDVNAALGRAGAQNPV